MTDKCDEWDFNHKPRDVTDIVERLRELEGYYSPHGAHPKMYYVIKEAANEIERLRDMLGRTQEEAGEFLHIKINLHGHIKRLEDENAKLRKILNHSPQQDSN